MTVHRGPWAPNRLRNAVQLCVDAGDQPSSAIAASRGNAMNSMFADVRIVSVHSGASTPSTAGSDTPTRYEPGFQPYASFTSMRPAQSCPSGVLSVYFMSRYALLAGESTSLVPFFVAAATAGLLLSVSQNCATVDGNVVASCATWCQARTVLPCAATIFCALSMNAL